DTWVGAVDRIKGALRDISSELLTPWIDPEGGGAAIDLANAFADALRRIQREVVPVIQEMSARLAPALADLGRAAFPLLQSAIEGLLPLMGTTTQVMLILAPV